MCCDVGGTRGRWDCIHCPSAVKEIRRSKTWGILEQALILSTDAREVVCDGRCFDSSDSEKYHREIATDKGHCNRMTDGAGVQWDENPNARRVTRPVIACYVALHLLNACLSSSRIANAGIQRRQSTGEVQARGKRSVEGFNMPSGLQAFYIPFGEKKELFRLSGLRVSERFAEGVCWHVVVGGQ